jgi:DNA-directed RNA polymerase specialized sigma24 family protein
MDHKSESRPKSNCETLHISHAHSEAFDTLFSRYRLVLHSIAYRVLCNHQDAESAVQSLFLAASNNIPRFECEGSLRSWLLRRLIDEALSILHRNRLGSATCSESILNSVRFLPPSDLSETT